MNTVLWRGFRFDIYPFSADWNPVGGVYVFSRFNYQNWWWDTLYVGKTGSFRDRIPCHERWAEAVGLGATSVLALVVPAVLRAGVEQALIEEFQPPLNDQLRPKPADLWLQLLFPIQGFGLSR